MPSIGTKRTITMLTIVMVLVCLAMNTTAMAQSTSAKKEQDIARTNELRRRIEAEQLERVQRLKDSFEVKVKETTGLLSRLAKETEVFTKERKGLLTNDQGKALVADSTSFMAYLRLHDHPAVVVNDIKDKQIAALNILQSIQDEQKEVNVGYLPSPELFDELNTLHAWAKDRLARLEAQRATLKIVLAEAPKLKDPKAAKTLSKAIEEYRAKLPKLLAEAKILGEQLAEAPSKEILIEAARLAKLEEAQAERDRLLEQSRMEIAQLKLEQEMELLRVTSQAERDRYKAERRYKDTLAELERLRQDAEVERKVEDVESDLTRQKKLDEAKRKEQVAMLNSPDVQDLMSSFFAKGYSQPGKRGVTREPAPISYKQLRTVGALKEDTNGLKNLFKVVTSADSDRPRWARRGKKLIGLSNDERDRLVRAQELLIELGPLMVEEGMLSP